MEIFIIGKQQPNTKVNLDFLIPLRVHWTAHFSKVTLADTQDKTYPPAAFYSLEDAKEIIRKADNTIEEKLEMWIICLKTQSYVGMSQKEILHGQ
jgi:hypothetical protein